jgi:hypothetical protein
MAFKELAGEERSILQREAWVEEVFKWVRNYLGSYGNSDITTCSALCTTSLVNSYVRGRVFPFINIPIRYQNKELLGLYEYCGDEWPLSGNYIYCDFIIQSIYYAENKDAGRMSLLENKTRDYFKSLGYEILQFCDGMVTITIERSILEKETEFKNLLAKLLADALAMQKDIS